MYLTFVAQDTLRYLVITMESRAGHTGANIPNINAYAAADHHSYS